MNPSPLSTLQESATQYGSARLSDKELISLLVGSTEAGAALFEALGSIRRILAADATELKGAGVTANRRLQLDAIGELYRRASQPETRTLLSGPDLVFEHFKAQVIGLQVEKLWVCCLDRKNRLIRQIEVTSGTATGSLVHPREVFRAAIRESACMIIVVHNHPSGDPAPSQADIQVTRRLREAAQAVDIELADHVIIGTPTGDPAARGYYSFRAAGLL